jgi:hypothetical protein
METDKYTSKKINYPFNAYSGGRHLNAISHSKNLSMLEKHFMLTIGSLIDFRDFENSAYYISAKKLAELMSCTERTILNLVRSLNDKKYIIVENRFDENKRQMSNLYALSPLIFEEYATLWYERSSGGRVNDVHTVTPLEELPQENTILGVPNIVCACAPTPNQNNEVSIDEVKVEKKIKPEAKNKKPRAPKYTRPPVTQSHQKVGRIFIPDSRYVKKTYYDKTAMFFLIDEFLTKHGEVGHKAIDELYKFCKSTNACGRSEFDLGVIEDALEASIEKFIITIGLNNGFE